MSSNAIEISLGDVTKLVIDYRGKTPLKLGRAWSSSGYRAVSAKNIESGRLKNLESIRFVDETLYKKWMKDEVERGDILVTSEAPFGEVILWNSDEKIVLSQRVFGLRLDTNKVKPEYVYFYMQTSAYKAELEARATGSTVRGLRQPELLKTKILLPEISTQEKITKILGDLDRKIELNRRMNETLEQIGQALFKKYFVDNAEKENWKESQITDLADYKKSTRKPQDEKEERFFHYSIPAFDNGLKVDTVLGSEIKSNKYQVIDHSILVSKLNPSTPRIWPVFGVDSNAICSTEFVVLKPKKYYAFIYFLLNSRIYQETMIAAAGGTSNSHKRVSPEFINSFPFPMPPEDLLEEFELATKNFLIKRDLNIKMNKVLADLRDSLLPKLIGGEIEL